MTLCVVFLDMFKLRRVLESRYVPVQLSQPLVQCRIARSDITDVALEMLNIDRVKSNDGSVEANVCLGDVRTIIIGSSVFGKVSFSAVEGGEKRFDGFFISFLRSAFGKRVAKSLALIRNEDMQRESERT